MINDHSVMVRSSSIVDELFPFDCLNFDEVVHSEPQLSNQWMEFLAIYTMVIGQCTLRFVGKSLVIEDSLSCCLTINEQSMEFHLSYDVAPRSKITPCNKNCKPLVVYRFSGNVMTSITTLHT